MIDQQKPRMQAECETIADDGLATAMHATWVAAHSQLEYCSPSSITFGHGIKHTIPY